MHQDCSQLPENDVDCNKNKEYCPHAETAANSAVRKVFAILGVDIDKPESVEEFRMDLRFGNKLRIAADRGMMALVVAMFLFVGSLVWVGFMSKITGDG